MHHVVSERGTDKARQRSDLGSTKIQSCLDGATISVVGERAQLQIGFFSVQTGTVVWFPNPIVLGIHKPIGDLANIY